MNIEQQMYEADKNKTTRFMSLCATLIVTFVMFQFFSCAKEDTALRYQKEMRFSELQKHIDYHHTKATLKCAYNEE